MLDEVGQDVRREEGRKRRAEADVPDAKVQKRQQNRDGLLLVPRKDHRKRQLVDAAIECACQGKGNLDRAVRVVALADVKQTRNAADCAEIEVIEAVLAAGKRQNHGVLWGLFHKLGVIIPARARAVAAADQEEMPDCAGLHAINHLTGHGQDCISGKAGRDGFAAVDAGEALVFLVAAKCDGLRNDGGEVFLFADML